MRFIGRPIRSRHARIAASVTALVSLLLTLGPAAHAATAMHDWEMDEPKGAGTMLDAGATPTPGTWQNITAGVPGFTATAYAFDGSSSRVRVPDDPSLDPASAAFSVTVHVNFTVVPNSSNVGDYDLVRKGLSGTTGGYWKVEIYPDSTGTNALARCQMKGSAGGAKITKAPYPLNDGAWHTIVCAKTDSGISLQVDSRTYRKSAAIGSIANGADLTLGAKSSGGDWFNGVMDDVSYQIG